MRAIWVILTARARRQWQGWLLLTLLVAIGTGVVLSAVTAGRRADSAFPGYVAAHGYDAIVYPLHPLPLATLPEVTEAVAVRAPFAGDRRARAASRSTTATSPSGRCPRRTCPR